MMAWRALATDGSAAFVDAIGTPADAKGLILYDGALHDLFEEDTRNQVRGAIEGGGEGGLCNPLIFKTRWF